MHDIIERELRDRGTPFPTPRSALSKYFAKLSGPGLAQQPGSKRHKPGHGHQMTESQRQTVARVFAKHGVSGSLRDDLEAWARTSEAATPLWEKLPRYKMRLLIEDLRDSGVVVSDAERRKKSAIKRRVRVWWDSLNNEMMETATCEPEVQEVDWEAEVDGDGDGDGDGRQNAD